MKCAACGYEHRRIKTVEADKVTFFKLGKDKGKVKNVEPFREEVWIGDEPFVRITNQARIVPMETVNEAAPGDEPTSEPVMLYGCPKCNTVQFSTILRYF